MNGGTHFDSLSKFWTSVGEWQLLWLATRPNKGVFVGPDMKVKQSASRNIGGGKTPNIS